MVCQSDQSGIETGFPFLSPVTRRYCQSDQSGIETQDFGSSFLYREAANRTNLELKRVNWFRYQYPHLLPIGPIWNWNVKIVLAPVGNSWLPIGPIWNWNRDFWSCWTQTGMLPIGPIWNWNSFGSKACLPPDHCQSDQSGIETQKWV